jgi:hypothetical protein
MKRRLVVAAAGLALVPLVLSMLATGHSIAQEAGAATPLFTAYPQYSAEFDLAAERFRLITNMLVYDTSGKTFTEVTFKQTYPEGIWARDLLHRSGGEAADDEAAGQHLQPVQVLERGR